MTEIDLIDALAEESKEALKGFRLRSAKENLIPINIYTQNLPIKEGKGDESQYPYVLVCFDKDEMADQDSDLSVFIYFIIGILDRAKDKQGYRDVLQIAEQIKQHFFRKGIIQGAFRLGYPVKTMLQQGDTYPYFFGGIEAKCNLFIVMEEDDLI